MLTSIMTLFPKFMEKCLFFKPYQRSGMMLQIVAKVTTQNEP